MSVKVAIHGVGTGTCSLTGKESCDGLTVSFEDGTISQGFLSYKAFQQLLKMKCAQPKPETKAEPRVAAVAQPATNSQPK